MMVARIRVDEHDLYALFAQRFAGLGAGEIELCCLADLDRPDPMSRTL